MKVLLVIDMLKDFMEEGGALFCGEKSREIIPFVKDKIAEYRQSGFKVIYVCDAHAPDDKEFKMFSNHAVKGTEGAKVIEEIKPEKSDIVMEKTTVINVVIVAICKEGFIPIFSVKYFPKKAPKIYVADEMELTIPTIFELNPC